MNGVNDAMILRRFAQKMAYNPSAAVTAQTMDVNSPSATSVTAGSMPQSVEMTADAIKGLPGGYDDATPRTLARPPENVNEHYQKFKADASSAIDNNVRPYYDAAAGAAKPYLPANLELSDIIAGVGGAGLGGLGAMGLARLFQSERDKERGRTPMLAGLAGAGAGAIGLPMLLKYLASQGGAQTAAGPAAAPDVAKQIIANA